ncbi:MAG: hypothetical protein OXE58_15660 [Acidobacteria bacterium]|nr:hypothetical protein [Acidobacteriota bacterium]
MPAALGDGLGCPGHGFLSAWLSGTRGAWGGRGPSGLLDESQEGGAIERACREIVAKPKTRSYEMRSPLPHLPFDVVKYEPHPIHNGDSKVYLSKRLGGGMRRPRRASLARYLEV